jgi:hypothetical protein
MGGGLLAMAAVLALAPAGLGAVPSHTTTLKAPYKTLISAAFSSTNSVGCGTDKIVTAPHFSPHTGTGGFSVGGIAPACGKVPNGIANRGIATGQVSIVVPIKVAHTAVSIVANWTLSAAGSVSLTSAPCPSSSAVSYACYEFAEVYVFAQAYLIDTTNGTLTFSSNFWAGLQNASENDTFCNGGSCTTAILGGSSGGFSSTQQVSFYVNGTSLNNTHTYVLEVDLYGAADAELDSSNTHLIGGHASASLNFATLGNGAKLNSIVYS